MHAASVHVREVACAADKVSMLQLLVYLSTTLPRCIGNVTQRGGWDAVSKGVPVWAHPVNNR